MPKTTKTKSSNNNLKIALHEVVHEEQIGLEKRLKQHLRWEFMEAESGLRDDWKKDIKDEIEETFQKYRDDVLTGLDKVMGELLKIREDYEIMKGRHHQILDLENKVEKLEHIHTSGHHATV